MATLQTNLDALVTQIGTDMGLVQDDIAAALAAIAALPSAASVSAVTPAPINRHMLSSMAAQRTSERIRFFI